MTSHFSLMYLMCSKICHDLATPLGAISLGLDMLPEPNESDSPINLLKQSVTSAGHKLELFRCLTGYATASDKPHLSEIHELLLKQMDPGKHKIHWNIPDSIDDIKGLPVRLILALIMIALDSLPRGGELRLGKDFSLHFFGSYCKLRESTLAALEGNMTAESLNSRVIIAHFAYLMCQELGAKLAISYPKQNAVLFQLS